MSEFESIQSRVGGKSSTKSKEETKNSSFSLQVVSPSAGVPKSLDFHDLPVTTQVKDLKKLIRDTLSCRPPDDLQRLIHHGRMLTRETETMSEIFGEEALRNSNVQIVHLVLRPGPENLENSSSNNNKATDIPANPISMHHSQSQTTETATQSLSSANHSQDSQTRPLVTAYQYQQQHNVLYQLEELQSLMGQRLLQLQHETQRLNQELHNMGVQASFRPSFSEYGLNEQSLPYQSTSSSQDSMSSDQANTISNLQNQIKISRMSQKSIRSEDSVCGNTTQGTNISRPGQETQEYQGPDQPVPNRESTVPISQGLSNNTYEAISNQPSQNHQQNFEQLTDLTNDLRSILWNPNMPNRSNQQHGPHDSLNINTESSGPKMFSSPTLPTSSINPVVNPIPFGSSSKSAGETLGTDFRTPNTFINSKPLVYILSSPSGPRAILMSNAHFYFTPSRNPGRNRFNVGNSGLMGVSSSMFLDRARSTRRQARQARETRNQNEQAAEPRAAAPPANLRAGGIGIQLGQILWLVIRLAGLVWFFTAGNPSWSRWLVASGFAFFVFIILTGVLNGAVEQIWSPIRRHLESLVPLGPLHPPNIPLQQNRIPELARGEDRTQGIPQLDSGNYNTDNSRSELNIEINGRSVGQRAQTNNGLLMTRLRRLEQSLILFVASLVPGVSERHIAHREAQANRELERQQQLMQATAEQTSRVSSENNLSASIQDGENSITNEQNQTDRPLG